MGSRSWGRAVLAGLWVVAVVLGAADGARGQQAAPDGGAVVTVSPGVDVLPGQVVTVEGSGFAEGAYDLWWCRPGADPGAPDSITEGCALHRTALGVPEIAVGPGGGFAVPFRAAREIGYFERFLCGDGPDACLVVVEAAGADPADPAAASAAVAMVPETLTVTPATGVLDGQVVLIEATGLAPGADEMVFVCPPGVSDYAYHLLTRCDYTFGVHGEADGRGSLALPVSFRVGGPPVICTDQCEVRVTMGRTTGGSGRTRGVPFSFAEGDVSVTPDAGLADGQAVQVDATGLMPTYRDGRPVWIFPSGAWALVQCDAAVGESPSLYATFAGCAAAPTSRTVDVPGSELHEPIEVRAGFTSFLGDQVDCTGSPGDCVVGLIRLEEDGTVTTHLAPIALLR